MSELPRRDFLSGLGTAAVSAGLAPAARAAPPDPLQARVAALRAEWEAGENEFVDSFYVDQPTARAEAAGGPVSHIARGMSALVVHKALSWVELDDQAHAAVQALMHDVATAIGHAIVTCCELLDLFLDGPGLEPGGEVHLAAALYSMKFGISDWKVSEREKRGLRTQIEQLQGDRTPGAILRKARRARRKAHRLVALAEGISELPGRSGLIEITDPATVCTFEAGRTRLGARSAAPRPLVKAGTVALVLGLIVLGMGLIGGGYIALVGLMCLIDCGEGAGILLLGLGIMGLSLWGGVALVKVGVQRREQARPPDPNTPPSVEEIRTPTERTRSHEGTGYRVEVSPHRGWVEVTSVRPGMRVEIDASGRIQSPSGWTATADGNGVIADEGAPLPGAPVCSLLARVGDRPFYVGTKTAFEVSRSGRLSLSSNVTVSAGTALDGTFEVNVDVRDGEAP